MMSEAENTEAHPFFNSTEATRDVLAVSDDLDTSLKTTGSGLFTLQNDLDPFENFNASYNSSDSNPHSNLNAFIIHHLSQAQEPVCFSAAHRLNSSKNDVEGIPDLNVQGIDAYSSQTHPSGADSFAIDSTKVKTHFLENTDDFASFSDLFSSDFSLYPFITANDEKTKILSYQSLIESDSKKNPTNIVKHPDNELIDDISKAMSFQNNSSFKLESNSSHKKSSTSTFPALSENTKISTNFKYHDSFHDNSNESFFPNSLVSFNSILPQKINSSDTNTTSLAPKDCSDIPNKSFSQSSSDLIEQANIKESIPKPQLHLTLKAADTTNRTVFDNKKESESQSEEIPRIALNCSNECKFDTKVSEPSTRVSNSARGRKPKKVSTETAEARKKRLAADAARKRESRLLRKMELSQFLQPNHVIEARQQRLAAEAARKRHSRLLEKLESVGLNTNSLFVEGRIQPQPQPIQVPLIPLDSFSENPTSIILNGPSLNQNLSDTSSDPHTGFASPKATPLEFENPTPTIRHKLFIKDLHDKNLPHEWLNPRFRAIAPAFSFNITQIFNSPDPNNLSFSQQIPMPFNQTAQLNISETSVSPSFGNIYNSLSSFTTTAQSSQSEPFSSGIANFYQHSELIQSSQTHEATFSSKRIRKTSSNLNIDTPKTKRKENLVKRRIIKEKLPKLDAQGIPIPVTGRSRKNSELVPYNHSNSATFSNKINNNSFINSMLPVSGSLGNASQHTFMLQEPSALDISTPFAFSQFL